MKRRRMYPSAIDELFEIVPPSLHSKLSEWVTRSVATHSVSTRIPLRPLFSCDFKAADEFKPDFSAFDKTNYRLPSDDELNHRIERAAFELMRELIKPGFDVVKADTEISNEGSWPPAELILTVWVNSFKDDK